MDDFDGWTLRRIAWTAGGVIAVALGAIGAVLPVLPTTPFVILAAFAFGKGSPAMARWLEEHKIFGPAISGWRRNGAIAPRAKALAVAMMATVLGVSIAMALPAVVLAIQAVAMGGAAIFILTRPSR